MFGKSDHMLFNIWNVTPLGWNCCLTFYFCPSTFSHMWTCSPAPFHGAKSRKVNAIWTFLSIEIWIQASWDLWGFVFGFWFGQVLLLKAFCLPASLWPFTFAYVYIILRKWHLSVQTCLFIPHEYLYGFLHWLCSVMCVHAGQKHTAADKSLNHLDNCGTLLLRWQHPGLCWLTARLVWNFLYLLFPLSVPLILISWFVFWSWFPLNSPRTLK